MNIFFLHPEPKQAAIWHCNEHVWKMPIESGQMLSMAHRLLDGQKVEYTKDTGKKISRWKHPDQKLDKILYKVNKSHAKHPCTLWVLESTSNYNWLYELFVYQCEEYIFRRKKSILTDTKLRSILKNPPENLIDLGMTKPRLCMKESFQINGDPVKSYRNFYLHDKLKFATWTGRKKPFWVTEFEQNNTIFG